MEAILIVLGIAAIWLIYYLLSKDKRDKSEPPEAPRPTKSTGLKITLPGSETIKPAEPGPRAKSEQTSSDYRYAMSHGMWVCRHCESLNGNEAQSCAACGGEKAG